MTDPERPMTDPERPMTDPERPMTDRPGPDRPMPDADRPMRDRLGRGLVSWLPVGLALLAEAAWLAVVGGLLQAIVLQPPSPSIGGLVLAAVAGLVSARRLGPRLGDRWPGLAVALATMCGMAGWLAAPEVRAILAADGFAGILPALAVHPGGWLLWPAFVRGMAYARVPLEPHRVATLLAAGVPLIAVCAVLGGMIGEPTGSAYLDAVRTDAVVFLASAIPSLALARLAAMAPGASLDWRRNPLWLALVMVLLVVAIGAALLLATFAGKAISTAVAAVLVPLLVVGFIVGFDRRSLRILAVSILAAGVIGVLLGLFEDPARQGAAIGSVVPSTPQEAAAQTGLAIGVLVVVLAAAVILVAALAKLWLSRPSPRPPGEDEVREIAHDGEVTHTRRKPRRRFGRRRTPVDAVTAYQALLEDLEGRPIVARELGETPVEHARRLRGAGAGSLELELLAADYGLARFGGVELSAAEHRRALARAALLRRSLGAVARAAGRTAAADADGHAAAGSAGRTAPVGPVVRGSGRSGGAGADMPDFDQPGVAATLLNRIRRGP